MLRIRDVYPGSRILIFTFPDPGPLIPDPNTATKPIFVATNFTKLNINLFLITQKKFSPIFQELLKFLPKKLSPSPQKYGFGIPDQEKCDRSSENVENLNSATGKMRSLLREC